MKALKKTLLYTILLCTHCALVAGPQKPSQHPIQTTIDRIEQGIEEQNQIIESFKTSFYSFAKRFRIYKKEIKELHAKKDTFFAKLYEYEHILDGIYALQKEIDIFIALVTNYSQNIFEQMFKNGINKLNNSINVLLVTIRETLSEEYPKLLDEIENDLDHADDLTAADFSEMLIILQNYKNNAEQTELHTKLYSAHKNTIEILEKQVQERLKTFQEQETQKK